MSEGSSLHIAMIGNAPPRRCGIATFSHDLREALVRSRSGTSVVTVAMDDRPESYDYPPYVRFSLRQHERADYAKAAAALNAGGVDAVSLQHEFGLFGGPAGRHVVELLRALDMPVVTTLHTVLERPDPVQREVTLALARYSSRLVTMSERGATFLEEVYGVPRRKIVRIPHGIPDTPFVDALERAKRELGLEGKTVMMTFGLLSQNKGIETAIRALPAVVAAHPDLVYLVLGATHPNVLAHEGERYRESLVRLAREVGVEQHVRFDNRFLASSDLVRYLAGADLYVTPYLNREQITSGTLCYALGMGKAVVSTPYWHAEELLADGRGALVPFGDSEALAETLLVLLGDDERRAHMRCAAYRYGRAMVWPAVAARYAATLAEVVEEARIERIGVEGAGRAGRPVRLVLPPAREPVA